MPLHHSDPTHNLPSRPTDAAQANDLAAVEELLAYVPMDRRHALVHGMDLPDRTVGAALFADISGFTQLTEELVQALGRQRGVEELIQTINQVYAALINRVHAHTGSVIAFAGDAITCWFDGDDGRRATSAALAMQQSMAMFVAVPTPTGKAVRLAMKASVAVGPARRFLVGDPADRVIEAIAGATLTRLAQGEKLANAGEVLIDAAARRAWSEADSMHETRTAHADGDTANDDAANDGTAVFTVLSAGQLPAPGQPWPPLSTAGLQPAQLRPWLLPAIHQRLLQGLSTFLTELRPTVALFVRFAGIDYDGDDAAGLKLDRFIRRVQTVVARYDGTLIDLNIGDKGSYLYVNFGAPFAHEDDAIRAVNAALDLRHAAAEFDYIAPLQIGISQGRMRAGAYGARSHRTYGVLGDEVNMAARLMMVATPGQILVSEEARRFLGEAFDLDEQPPRRLKGRDRPVVAYAAMGRAAQTRAGIALPATTAPMIGRQGELAQLRADLAGARTGRGAVVSLTGDAGLGKSRLIAEALRLADDDGFRIYAGEGASYGVNSSYLAWQPIWRHVFDITPDLDGDALTARIHAKLRAVKPGLIRRAPLLAPVLNVSLAENELTRSLDARARKASLESLLLDCLRAETAHAPMVLVLEDCQWLDPLSLDLLEVIGRALETLPALLLLAYRDRGQEQAHATRISALPNHRDIILAPLTYAEAREFVASKFRLTGTDGHAIAPALIQAIVDQAEGNPFYIEELINFLLAREIDPTAPGALTKLQLPSTLHNLVLSRVDQLSERQKITIKVASIIGRTFQADWLWEAFPALRDRVSTVDDLHSIADRELIVHAPGSDEYAYFFRHVVTQGVTYESLPYATRSKMHEQFGAFMEARYTAALDQYVNLLAYHYGQTENRAKKVHYLQKAGELAQAEYANESAIAYFQDLLPLVDADGQIGLRRKLGSVLQLLGRWDEARAEFDRALHAAEAAVHAAEIAQCCYALAEHLRRRGEYGDAAAMLARAQELFAAVDDPIGLATTYSTAGTLAAQQGRYDQAQAEYGRSLAIFRTHDAPPSVANVLNNLAIVARFQGDYQESRRLHEEALAIRRAVGDPLAISTSLSNLGNVSLDLDDLFAARRYQEEALALRREIGDLWAVANSLNNLANVTRGLRDFDTSGAMYAESLRINRQLGDRWALAYLLEDMGVLAAQMDQAARALCLVGAAATARTAIGAPRSTAETEKLDQALQPVLARLEPRLADALLSQGAAMTLDEVVTYALDEQPFPDIPTTDDPA